MKLVQAARRLRSYSYQVPWCVPQWGWSELGATVRPLLAASATSGPAIDRVAGAIKSAVGRRHAIPVGRGRDAIWLALRALNLTDSDEVVMPAYICRSVLQAVQLAGASPVFADVGEDLHLSAATVARAVTPATRCIIVPHLFGNVAPVDEIAAAAALRGIAVIDDAAQGFGCSIAGRPAGSYGAFGVVCGGPGKPLTTPSGGFLLIDDDALYKSAMSVRPQLASAGHDFKEIVDFWTWRRFRRQTRPMSVVVERFARDSERLVQPRGMTNLQASLLEAQLRRMDQEEATRRDVFRRWLELLAPLGWTPLTKPEPGRLALKGIFLLPPHSSDGEAAVAELASAGIEAQLGYPPCHPPECKGQLGVTERIWRRVLCIPLDTRIADESRVRSFVDAWLRTTAGASAKRGAA